MCQYFTQAAAHVNWKIADGSCIITFAALNQIFTPGAVANQKHTVKMKGAMYKNRPHSMRALYRAKRLVLGPPRSRIPFFQVVRTPAGPHAMAQPRPETQTPVG